MSSTSLYNMITRSNKSTVFKSVFVHPQDSQVSIENNGNDKYEELHTTESGFRKAFSMIMKEIGKHYDDIEKSGKGYIDVAFYSTYNGRHIYLSLYKDANGKVNVI